MSVIVNLETRVVVRGITGNEGRFHTISMLKYGTKIVAGVTPGKGGQEVEGVPVFDTVNEAIDKQNANTSILFVPARFAKNAVLDDIDAGIKTIVVITEGIPIKDEIELVAKADKERVIIIGPNCPGIINPAGKIKVGILPVHIFKPGSIGIASRSGTLTYEIAWHITSAGLGQSTCIGIGGDPVIGLDFIKMLKMFEQDPETKGVVLIGEIGGDAEEMAAKYIKENGYSKPVVAYITGRMAPPGKRMGHAGAIIMGDTGTAQSKIQAFSEVGIPVAIRPSEIKDLMRI